jgi:competence protein ComEC
VCLLSLLFLWSYACLTGLSPSVVRAAWMFSFIACGKLFRSGHQKWNSIAASALLMLVFDPFIWLDAGFQLSFFAVWGIVSLGKLPEKLLTKFKWVNYTLEAAWISCVAQFCTLPVSLYIFGKFPVYFLLANIFAVPLSTCITYWGIFCFIILPIPFLATYSCKILGWGIDLMNFIATTIAEMPSSTFTDIHLSFFQSVWIAFFIYVIAAKFLSSMQKIKTVLMCTLIISAANWISFFSNMKTSYLVYYSNSTA